MKKAIAITMASLMLLAALAGCGEDESSSKANATTTAAATTEAAATTTAAATTATTASTTKANGGNVQVTPTTARQTQKTTSSNNELTGTPLEAPLAVDKKTVGDTMKSNITNKTYELKFIDDFSGTSLNKNNWNINDGNGNSNGVELQANMAKNLDVSKGTLKIWMRKENATRVYNGETQNVEYTGGKFDSRGKVAYQYGRFEIYCKLPNAMGSWPAFWTMGQGVAGAGSDSSDYWWPWGGEIDIMEMNGTRNGYASAVHWATPETVGNDAYKEPGHKSTSGGSFILPNSYDMYSGKVTEVMNDKFHIIGMEWTPTKIHFYCDGRKYGEVDITDVGMRRAFHNVHYIILNYALGGMGGTPEDSAFPEAFEIDWVKVWQEV